MVYKTQTVTSTFMTWKSIWNVFRDHADTLLLIMVSPVLVTIWWNLGHFSHSILGCPPLVLGPSISCFHACTAGKLKLFLFAYHETVYKDQNLVIVLKTLHAWFWFSVQSTSIWYSKLICTNWKWFYAYKDMSKLSFRQLRVLSALSVLIKITEAYSIIIKEAQLTKWGSLAVQSKTTCLAEYLSIGKSWRWGQWWCCRYCSSSMQQWWLKLTQRKVHSFIGTV